MCLCVSIHCLCLNHKQKKIKKKKKPTELAVSPRTGMSTDAQPNGATELGDSSAGLSGCRVAGPVEQTVGQWCSTGAVCKYVGVTTFEICVSSFEN